MIFYVTKQNLKDINDYHITTKQGGELFWVNILTMKLEICQR